VNEPPTAIRVVVDRKEGKVAVLVADDGRSFDVPATDLPSSCRAEGAVLDVPVPSSQTPEWAKAKRNRNEEHKRQQQAAEILENLKKRDPGGDIEL